MSQLHKSNNTGRQRLIKKGCTVNEIKGELRKKFHTRIKDIRNQLLDSHRNINQKELIDKGYSEIKDLILSDTWSDNEFDEAEIIKVLDEVQEEMEEYLNRTSEQYDEQVQKETDAIVENLFACRVCERLLDNNATEICTGCLEQHFND
ncbi:PREDICTED: uncharacterized protein LOC108568183 [Nicrophorus vespilloides]|uniref:Uncharacterized protein LOC108568183 n=1 Tax=Nicrophorus vespilloides TaxID=110193 RepID=A0ABM1NCR0_NICVS|nr:PREDICTED: uncharacterized protein LOC108568183 [Nicrophorus vespilloides]XP_017784611.1 PREDICTED: uncharacterized protein LOC108568183 [Nicrophorus vespilloides]